jgi:hypothetical protein
MPVSFQVTIDCVDPHAQARFWAAALGYDLEDHSDLIRTLLDRGVASADDVVEIDGGLAWRTLAAIRHPADPPYGAPGARDARRILFQQVPDPTPGKNRWHFDLNVGKDDIDAQVARLITLGAQELYKVDEPGAFHTTMADPEGNRFCVQ